MPRKTSDAEKKKAPNGAGSMTFIESKQLYCFRISVNGKRLPFYDKSERIARQKGISAQARALTGQAAVSSQIKVEAWAKAWLETYKRALSARTRENYAEIMKKQILPHLGKYQLKTLKPLHIQKMINALVDAGYSKRTVSVSRMLTNAMLETAVDNDLLIKNPCRKIKLPEISVGEEKRPFTPLEETRLIEFVPAYLSPYKPHQPRLIGRMVIILLKTGMRQEELLALRWEDVDFASGVLHVRRALDIDPTDPTKAPKSAASTRDIPLHSLVCQQLHAVGILKEGFIFKTRGGSLFRTDNFRRDYKAYLAAAGVEYRSPHTTRHTFASDLRRAGVDAKTISKLLGHASVDISYDVYIHTDDEAKRDAIKKI